MIWAYTVCLPLHGCGIPGATYDVYYKRNGCCSSALGRGLGRIVEARALPAVAPNYRFVFGNSTA